MIKCLYFPECNLWRNTFLAQIRKSENEENLQMNVPTNLFPYFLRLPAAIKHTDIISASYSAYLVCDLIRLFGQYREDKQRRWIRWVSRH